MKSSLRTRSARALAAGALSVALLTSAAAAAFAADPAAPTPTGTPSMSASPSPMMSKSPMASPKPTMKASITIKANHTSVRTGHTVVFNGRTTALARGTKLELQRFNGKKWVTVKTTTVTRGGPYSATLKVTGTGKEKFRVVHSKTVSPTVTVTVTK